MKRRRHSLFFDGAAQALPFDDGRVAHGGKVVGHDQAAGAGPRVADAEQPQRVDEGARGGPCGERDERTELQPDFLAAVTPDAVRDAYLRRCPEARAGENVFTSPQGDVDPEVYLPAFVRRYPFVFASDPKSDKLLLCVDTEAQMVSSTPDVKFFEGEQASKFTEDAIEFRKEFERQRRATVEFVEMLDKTGHRVATLLDRSSRPDLPLMTGIGQAAIRRASGPCPPFSPSRSPTRPVS